ncbi:MAG: hypothetical protein ACK56I_15140, partial [bacterium]
AERPLRGKAIAYQRRSSMNKPSFDSSLEITATVGWKGSLWRRIGRPVRRSSYGGEPWGLDGQALLSAEG